MSKKTGIDKVLGRKDYVIVHRTVKIGNSGYKEVVAIMDFTFRG